MLEATRCSGGRRRKVLSRSDQLGGRDFDELYRDQRSLDGLPALTPWDIGEPQPAVQQLVAYGALSGQVLDPGTGPGHHAIHFASKGYATTGIDSSPAAIDRAKRNAQRAGARVDLRIADATRLDGFENRFDTVVDSAIYRVFLDDEEILRQYLQALHRATKPGARLFMFESGGTTSTASISRDCRRTISSDCCHGWAGASISSEPRRTKPISVPRRSRTCRGCAAGRTLRIGWRRCTISFA